MIHYIKKDVTAVTKGIVAHGCNCQGVMGSGVALAIKRKWPEAYDKYVWLFGKVGPNDAYTLLGTCQLIIIKDNELAVANLFTQLNYGHNNHKYADLNSIINALDQTFHWAEVYNLPIYMPRIGCGLGGLDWDSEVGPVVEKLCEIYADVELYVCDL